MNARFQIRKQDGRELTSDSASMFARLVKSGEVEEPDLIHDALTGGGARGARSGSWWVGGDAYGMTLRREIQERTGRDVTIGAVYSTLDRMESKGLIGSRLGRGDSDRAGRARRHFRIQPSGVEALARTEARASLA